MTETEQSVIGLLWLFIETLWLIYRYTTAYSAIYLLLDRLSSRGETFTLAGVNYSLREDNIFSSRGEYALLLYNMRKGFIQIPVWAKKNSSLDESKRKQTQCRRHSSILFGTTTYKAFKVRLRLFFSDFIGCCEWMP